MLATILAISACQAARDGGGAAITALPDETGSEAEWRTIASVEDQRLLDQLPDLWDRALAPMGRRDRAMIAGEGELLKRDGAQFHPAAPPGSYQCRLVRIDAEAERGASLRMFRDFFCNIASAEQGRLAFTKQTGTELPAGWLYPDGDLRWVLVGAKQEKPGDNSIAYGDAAERNIVGALERVGPFRWRLVLPRAGSLDVYELTPVPVERQAVEATARR